MLHQIWISPSRNCHRLFNRLEFFIKNSKYVRVFSNTHSTVRKTTHKQTPQFYATLTNSFLKTFRPSVTKVKRMMQDSMVSASQRHDTNMMFIRANFNALCVLSRQFQCSPYIMKTYVKKVVWLEIVNVLHGLVLMARIGHRVAEGWTYILKIFLI